MEDWIAKLFKFPGLAGMGHHQRVQDCNLGLGWLYYALARVIRPQKAVVIGSYRGFVPLVLAKALADNLEGGEVIFVDPSLVDDFWKDSPAVREHFARFDVTNVRHFLMTTQEFAGSSAYEALERVGMVFVDGYHTEEQARFDYETFEGLLEPDGVIILHDTSSCEISKIYGPARAYERRVKSFVDQLKQDSRLQVFDIPFGQGATLVRKLGSAEAERSEAGPGSTALP